VDHQPALGGYPVAVRREPRDSPPLGAEPGQGIPRLFGNDPAEVFCGQALDGSHNEAGGRVRLDPAATDHVELDPAASKRAKVVQSAGQVTGETVQMVDDD